MPITSSSVPTSLRIQIVLFDQTADEIARLIDSLLASVAVGRSEGSLSYVELALGDSSNDPCLDEESRAAILETASNHGFDTATYTFFSENLGSAGGSNRLAAGATTEFILVLNPDTYVSPWMLHRQIEAFRDDIGAVEARQLPVEHPKQYDPVTHEVSWASGACTMYRRSVFEEAEGFDAEHFFLHCDDVDLSWRIKLLGHRVVLAPTAMTLHHKPLSLSGSIEAPNVEKYYGLLGKLMLASRFDNAQLIEETSNWIRDHGDSVQQSALDEFERRAAAGSVPRALPKAKGVAQFVGSEYARHRF